MDFINQFIYDFTVLLSEMAPYLLLGFLFAGIIKEFAGQNYIQKHFGKQNTNSVIKAALVGVPLPLCSCGVIPTGISFYKNGASKGSAISFLISTPQTGLDSILVTWSMLGLPFAIIRPIISFITGIFGGVLSNKIEKTEPIQSKQVKTTEVKHGSRFSRLMHYAFNEFLMDIAKWLIIGLVIAAIISVLIPHGFFTKFSDYEVLSMLIVLIASIPLYVCATSSIPIAAVLLLKGLSPGAALVFLLAGPATNAATITVIKQELGKKALFAYLSSIIIGSFLFGLAINHLLPASWFSLSNISEGIHNHESFSILNIVSAAILVSLIIFGYSKKIISARRISKNMHANTLNEFNISGLTCNNCKIKLETAFHNTDGVDTATVSNDLKILHISGSITDAEIKRVVTETGYNI